LAQDTSLLARERASLRQTMLASPLLDQDGFARDMETAYRNMWKQLSGPETEEAAPPALQADSALPSSVEAALEHHRAGRLAEAEQIYRRVLQEQPTNIDALHSFGLLFHQRGDHTTAEFLIQRAISTLSTSTPAKEKKSDYFKLGSALLHANLGLVLQAAGKAEEAVSAFRTAVEAKPDYVDASFNLGNALQAQGKVDEAADWYRRVIRQQPNAVKAHNNLGLVLQQKGQVDEAMASFKRAIAIDAMFAEAHNNLGQALQVLGKTADAIDCYQRAIAIRPDFAEAYYNLGIAFKDQPANAVSCYLNVLAIRPNYPEALTNLAAAYTELDRLDDALACSSKAVAINPDYAEAHYNLGVALQKRVKLDDAIAAYRRAIELKPDYPTALNNLGDIYRAQGKPDEAISLYQRASELAPEGGYIQSNLLFCVNYHPTLTAEEVYARYREWNARCAARFAADIPPFA
ncbi:tetratricopeptide repeat protein, partial [Noviherbaspirillum sp. ST9]|uniref:tetratricopeptide repeat protein n=1 Tax=Noviherbaspirillum sp. ST9 TaxID=3401606 RepID=UPI003B586455